ncbi:MAG: hypothetical protein M3501_04500, partial [Actinomycetota bacterium]|nr:hypothetical protein [Actinomycetota bacterium]
RRHFAGDPLSFDLRIRRATGPQVRLDELVPHATGGLGFVDLVEDRGQLEVAGELVYQVDRG